MTTGDLALSLPLNGVQLIEASAGTGKTWTIAGLYLRFVVERRLSVREILVVTYTRAATDELKERLHQRLNDCANLAEGRLRREAKTSSDQGAEDGESVGVAGEDLFATTLVERACVAGESLLDLARRLRLEASSMDEAAIHTIHAFCARALREQAFASGEAFDAGELIGSDRDLVVEIAGDFWRQMASDTVHIDDFDVLREKVGSADALGRLAMTMLDPDIAVFPQTEHDDASARRELAAAVAARDVAEATLHAAWRESGEQQFTHVLAAAAARQLNGTSYPLKKIKAWRETCCLAFADARIPDVDMLIKLGAVKLRAALNKNQPTPAILSFAIAIDDFLAAETAIAAARTAQWPIVLSAARDFVRHELVRRKQRSARQSYDDLIQRLHAAITDSTRGARLAAALHERFTVALIDEFQDTDARQFEIFDAMHRAGNDGTLFLVGDPKQAIYRFRGGDIQAYLAAAENADARHRLDRNFRSSPALLRAIEAVYAQAQPGQAFVDPRIEFHPVQAGGRAANDDIVIDGAPIMPLTLWHLPDALAGCNKDDGRAALAAACAQTIVELLRKGGQGAATRIDRAVEVRRALAPRDIAVLVMTNAEAIVMQDALAARGVASATIRKESLFKTAEAVEMLTLLGALESRDERGLRAALATRLFGFDATRIAALAEAAAPERWLGELERLDALDRVWRQHGVLAMFQRVFEAHAAEVLAGVGGERRLTNYLQLAEWLQRESAQVFGADGLIAHLRARIASADADNEEEQLRLESDGDRVLIATIHASKGLEYDLVFVPFSALKPGRYGSLPATFAWHDGARRCVRVRACGETEDAALSTAIAQAECEELAERMRVLYVALTRARYAVWLSWDVVGKRDALPALAKLWHDGVMPDDGASTRVALEQVARAAPDIVRVAALPTPGHERLQETATTTLPPARRFGGAIDTSWWTHSFSQWRDGEHAPLGDDNGADDEQRVDVAAADDDPASHSTAARDEPASSNEIATWPSGATFGTAFHEILERVDFAAWRDHRDDRPPVGAATLIDSVLRRLALSGGKRDGELVRVVTRMVATTLNARLPGEVRLGDLAPAQRCAELPFHFAIAGVRMAALTELLQRFGYQRRRLVFERAKGDIAGLMTGIIDLVYVADRRWWLVDYKTNALGAHAADYQGAALGAAIADGDYDLQYLIYTLALHRWLRTRLRDGYEYDRDLGGAIYLFVRGLDRDGTRGVFFDRPPRELIDALDALLAAPEPTS